MKTYPTTNENATDLTTLIGQPLSAEYSLLAQDEELREILAEDFEGYTDWSNDLEQFLFEAEQNEAKQSTITTLFTRAKAGLQPPHRIKPVT